MAWTFRLGRGTTPSLVAGAAITAGAVLQKHGGSQGVIEATTDAQQIVGVAATAAASGAALAVYTDGIFETTASGTVDTGANVAWGAGHTAKAAVAGDMVIGTCVKGNTTGLPILINLNPHNVLLV
jgi:hypothetical protein